MVRSPPQDAEPTHDPLQTAARATDRVRLANLNDAICVGSTCPPVVDGVLVYRDRQNLTATYGRGLAPLRAEQVPVLARNP